MGIYLIDSGRCMVVNNALEQKIMFEIGRGESFGDSFVYKQPSLDYFGDCKENGRLFQLFFFNTER